MGSLMRALLRLGALSAGAGAVAVSGHIGLFLAFGLIVLLFWACRRVGLDRHVRRSG